MGDVAARSFSIPPSRNLFFTDSLTFFAKLSKDDPAHEVAGAVHAHRSGVPTPAPLFDPIKCEDGWLSFYQWVTTGAPLSSPMDVLWALREVPRPDNSVQRTLSSKLLKARDALETWDFKSAKAWRHREELLVIFPALHASLALLESEANSTFLHGDFHPRNVLSDSAGMPVLVDWELWGWGPQEVDVCKWLASALAEGRASVETIMQVLTWAEVVGLSPDLLLVGVRAAGFGATTYHLRYGPEESVQYHKEIALNGLNARVLPFSGTFPY